MARSQFQVLIIPYRLASDGTPEYAVTKRSDMEAWQFLSGGGENQETPTEAARREANEEGGVPGDLEFLQLDSMASIPANNFSAHEEANQLLTWDSNRTALWEVHQRITMRSKTNPL
jgi:dATP pyrophosphohydrolase